MILAVQEQVFEYMASQNVTRAFDLEGMLAAALDVGLGGLEIKKVTANHPLSWLLRFFGYSKMQQWIPSIGIKEIL